MIRQLVSAGTVCLLYLTGTAGSSSLTSWFSGSDGDQQKNLKAAPRELVQEIDGYVRFAALAYRNLSQETDGLAGIRHQQFFPQRFDISASVFYRRAPHEVIVAFRGPDVPGMTFLTLDDDWAPLVAHPGLMVGKRVQLFALHLVTDVKRAIYRRLCRNPRVVLVGHSLGGSIATLAALLLVENSRLTASQIRVVTYNQPKVGDGKFANHYNSLHLNTTRVVNKHDDIPSRPPGADWHHVRGRVWVDPHDTYFLCADPADESCSYGSKNFSLNYDHVHVGKQKICEYKLTKD